MHARSDVPLFGSHVTCCHQAWSKPYSETLRNPQPRVFIAKFRGEGVVDQGGPYRAVFNTVVKELHDGCTGLLCVCPNGRGEFAEAQDMRQLSPSARSERQRRLLRFVGVLIGVALRCGVQLPLTLPALFWHKMTSPMASPSPAVATAFLEEVDAELARVVASSMDDGRDDATVSSDDDDNDGDDDGDEDDDGEAAGSDAACFCIDSTDGRRRLPLLPGGRRVPVNGIGAAGAAGDATVAVARQRRRRRLFGQLAMQCRLRESDEQVAVLLSGVGEVSGRLPCLVSLEVILSFILRHCTAHAREFNAGV